MKYVNMHVIFNCMDWNWWAWYEYTYETWLV